MWSFEFQRFVDLHVESIYSSLLTFLWWSSEFHGLLTYKLWSFEFQRFVDLQIIESIYSSLLTFLWWSSDFHGLLTYMLWSFEFQWFVDLQIMESIYSSLQTGVFSYSFNWPTGSRSLSNMVYGPTSDRNFFIRLFFEGVTALSFKIFHQECCVSNSSYIYIGITKNFARFLPYEDWIFAYHNSNLIGQFLNK